MIDLGDTVRLSANSTDAGGALTDADSVTLTITLPDGTTTSPAVANPPAVTGKYSVDYVAAQAGRHVVRWVFTTPESAYTDVLDVRPANPHFLFSHADAKKHLNIDADDTSDDEEIRDWNAATAFIVEYFVGPVARRTVVERHRDRRMNSIVLRQVPAISLTSVEPVLTNGVSYDVSGLDLDEETGEVLRLDGGSFAGPLRVTYVAGRVIPTPNIAQGGRIILQHLWRTQRGRMGAVMGGGEDYAVSEPIPGLGYAVPNRALELLQPDRLAPEVA